MSRQRLSIACATSSAGSDRWRRRICSVPVRKGRARADSDYDLALAGAAAELARLKLDILQALADEGFERVDLVLLEQADPFTRFEAVRPNCLVYADKDFDRGGLYSRVVREYFDWEPYLKIQREAVKRRWLDGQA